LLALGLLWLAASGRPVAAQMYGVGFRNTLMPASGGMAGTSTMTNAYALRGGVGIDSPVGEAIRFGQVGRIRRPPKAVLSNQVRKT
jgi:hypothetical protein